MSKYIEAERLIAYLEKEADKEFKKTEENANSPVLCHFHNGCRMQALDTIDFINQLQQEQPCEDLKGEIREWVNLMVGASFPEQDGDYISEEDYRSVIRQTALHFYELGKQSKEPVSEDLEEAAWECVLDSIDVNNPVLLPKYKELLLSLFIAGAEWQAERLLKGSPMPEDTVLFQKGIKEGKRLMMEEAVEGYVNYYEDGGGKLMAEAQVGCPYHIGDKVKIVIVKEDKE